MGRAAEALAGSTSSHGHLGTRKHSTHGASYDVDSRDSRGGGGLGVGPHGERCLRQALAPSGIISVAAEADAAKNAEGTGGGRGVPRTIA